MVVNSKKKLDFLKVLLFVILPVICFCGVLTSTMAWFTYTTMATVDYFGTAISTSQLLQIGIHTDIDLSEYGLTTVDGVAWSKPGEGLVPAQVTGYLEKAGFAFEQLTPLTTDIYDDGDELHLYRAPTHGVPYSKVDAEPAQFAQVPLAFKVVNATGAFVSGQNVWLSSIDVLCHEYEDLKNGVRLHFSNDDDKFIVHPSALESGYNALAGLQDLNKDGYYDFDLNQHEIMYGNYSGEPQRTHIEETTPLDDINHTGQTTESTFISKHFANTWAILSYDNLEIYQAHYHALSEVGPAKDEKGDLCDGMPVCKTGSLDGVGYTTLTIWIEGWDHYVYDIIEGYKFLLNLTFQVNPK